MPMKLSTNPRVCSGFHVELLCQLGRTGSLAHFVSVMHTSFNDDIILSQQQKMVLNLVETGANVFFTGPAGEVSQKISDHRKD